MPVLIVGGTGRTIWFETRCWLGVIGDRNGVGRASIRAVDFPDHPPAAPRPIAMRLCPDLLRSLTSAIRSTSHAANRSLRL
jgi:hypothetical protein